MRTSTLLGAFLALVVVGGVSFGAGYFMAKEEFQGAPRSEPVVAQDDSDKRPTLDDSAPLEATGKSGANPDEAGEQPQPKLNAKPEGETKPTIEQPEGADVNAVNDAVEAQPKETTPAKRTEADEIAEALGGLKKKLGDLKDLEKMRPEDIEEMINGPKVDFSATVAGQVLDGVGVPIAGAEIHASFSENYTSEGEGRSVRFVTSIGDGGGEVIATTDGGGYFTATINRKVSEKAGLNAALTATADGYAESKKNTVALKNGDNKEGIKLELRGAGGVTGRVVDASGRGVEGVSVGLNSAGGSFYGGDSIDIDFGGGSKYSAKTDVGGNFNIEGVPEGRYKFKLSGAGYRQVAGPTEVDVKSGLVESAATEFQVAITSSISASFTNADAAPVRGWATVSFKDDSGKTVKQLQGSLTDTGGFAQNDPPIGTFQVEIRVWGYKPYRVQATLTEGQRYDFGTITLEADEKSETPGVYFPGEDE